MILILMGVHIYFTICLRGIQKKIPLGIRLSVAGQQQGYSALATALAATIGTGNIVGVASAIAVGGPGAIFWCWITGVLGIATCYAECTLAVKYKVRTEDGTTYGGPMYVLEHGVGSKGLAVIFAICTVLASFGIGSSVQAHSIRTAVEQVATVSPHVIGMGTGVLAGLVIVGGSEQIAKVCTWLVPIMSILYLGGCVYILLSNWSVLPEALSCIIRDAFCGKAVVGGLVGRTVLIGMQTGISRGLFTNEAGMGSIPIAAASSGVTDAEHQGLVSMTGPFWDTVVMCAITGVSIVASMIENSSAYRDVPAEQWCFIAFSELPIYGEEVLALSLGLFAFATIIGWNVYGVAAVRYLSGDRGVKLYQVGYMVFAYLGAVLSMDAVWRVSDLFNILMAIPNLMGVLLLRREVISSAKCHNLTKNAERMLEICRIREFKKKK